MDSEVSDTSNKPSHQSTGIEMSSNSTHDEECLDNEFQNNAFTVQYLNHKTKWYEKENHCIHDQLVSKFDWKWYGNCLVKPIFSNRFHLVLGPENYIFIGIVLVMLTAFGLTNIYLLPYFDWKQSYTFKISQLIFTILGFVLFVSNPGQCVLKPKIILHDEDGYDYEIYNVNGYSKIDGEELYWCRQCRIKYNGNARHCNSCNSCFYNHDHHCGVIGKCIAGGNLILFYSIIVGVGFIQYGIGGSAFYLFYWKS